MKWHSRSHRAQRTDNPKPSEADVCYPWEVSAVQGGLPATEQELPPGRGRAAISGHVPKKKSWSTHPGTISIACQLIQLISCFPVLIVLSLDLLWPSQLRSHFWKLMLSKTYCWGLPNSSLTSNGSVSAREGQSCASQRQADPSPARRRQGVSQVFSFLSTTSYFSVFWECRHILHTQSLGNDHPLYWATDLKYPLIQFEGKT